jgi:hypothetical protein
MDTQVLLKICSVFCSLQGGTLLLQGWEQIAWNTIFKRLVSQRLWYIQSQLSLPLHSHCNKQTNAVIVTDILVSCENLLCSVHRSVEGLNVFIWLN